MYNDNPGTLVYEIIINLVRQGVDPVEAVIRAKLAIEELNKPAIK